MGIIPLHPSLVKPGMSNEHVCGRLIIYLLTCPECFVNPGSCGCLEGASLARKVSVGHWGHFICFTAHFTSIFFPDLGPLLLSLL